MISSFAEAFDRGQSEPDTLSRVDREVQLALVDVWRKDGDAAVAGLSQVDRELVRVLRFDRQQRRSEVPRVIRLEKRGLVREEGVRSGVRLVEPVAGEVLHQVEDLGRFLLVDSLVASPVHEGLTLLRHDLGIFLPHRLAQDVGLSKAESRQRLGDAHDLFLVRDDTVGVRQDRFELRKLVPDLGSPLLARHPVVHHAGLERAGTIERVQRNQVIEALGLGFPEKLAHARAFKLEDPE